MTAPHCGSTNRSDYPTKPIAMDRDVKHQNLTF